MRQLVGCGPAELEEIPDIPDADQPVSGPPGLPGGFRRRDGRVWQAVHRLSLAASGPDGFVVLSSAMRRGLCWLSTSAAPGSGRSPSCFCWLLISPGGWDVR